MAQKLEEKSYLSAQDFQLIPAEEISEISSDRTPMVSVLMITHNHEPYIAQAIESIVGQEYEFPFELIIGEDCSRDRTREICLDYQRRYSGKVRVVFSGTNVGMHHNFARIWHRSRGKYIAMCEGDDYWTDKYRLAKQVALLEQKPAMTMCGSYTDRIRESEDGQWLKSGIVGPYEIKEQYGLEDLIPNYTFHFSSIMLRKDTVSFPLWFWDVYCVDRPLYLLCAEKGPVGFLPEVMSVYRLHKGGIWSPSRNIEKASKGIKLFQHIDLYLDGLYRDLIRQTLGNIIWSYMAESLETGDLASARELFWLSMRYRSLGLGLSLLRVHFIVAMRLYFPLLYKGLRRLRYR